MWTKYLLIVNSNINIGLNIIALYLFPNINLQKLNATKLPIELK